jgi:hypothetical protein
MRLRRRREGQPISFEAFGVPVEVTIDDPGLEGAVRSILPPGWRECAPTEDVRRFGLRRTGEDAYEVSGNFASWLDDAKLEVALTMLDAEIRLHVASNARDRLFVHAGVVARDGRALVIPGLSFSGKTTLVAALVGAGARYYSDEYAVFDEAGLVHPYPRPLAIRSGDAAASRERWTPDPSAVVGDERGDVAAVVVTSYRPGAEWHPERISPGQAVVALLGHAVPGQQTAAQSLQTLHRAMAGATMLAGDRGEAGPVALALLDELGAVSAEE